MSSVQIASQTVRVEFKIVSLTDDTIYYYQWDALTTHPDIPDRFEKVIKADANYTDVKRTIRTTLV